MTDFAFSEILPISGDETPYRLLTTDGVSTFEANGNRFLQVEPEVLTNLTATAMRDIAHLLRPGHLQQLRNILDDPEASPNDYFVALELLKNANIAAGGVLPSLPGHRHGDHQGQEGPVRRRQRRRRRGASRPRRVRHLPDVEPALQPDGAAQHVGRGQHRRPTCPPRSRSRAIDGDAYKFMFMAKGGGSANKSYLFQETKALLNPTSLMAFLDKNLRYIGTSACPPYHLAIVIGGTSAEFAVETAKLASTRYLDSLPKEGSTLGHGFRDVELEAEVLKLTQSFGIGAQFGGKYFCHDVRVIRLPRHGASCPVAIAVSCSADRQALAKITADGVFLEDLEHDPARFLPEVNEAHFGGEVVQIDLNRPMDEVRAELSRYPVKTRLSLNGTLVVARDIAHAKIAERLAAGEEMPAYLRDHAVYYAGPAKTPTGMASGSFGPTTAGRMDSYVDRFQAAGGSMVMLAKGNRSQAVTDACKAHGGFYLGSIGGPAAKLAQDCIRHVEVLDYEELGMEAVWKIEIEDFPAFVVVDDKGNDFYADVSTPVSLR